MEAEKKKRRDNAGESSVLKTEEVNGEMTATEGEVEEFYAILRRIHVAVEYFKKGDGKKSRVLQQNYDKVNGGEKKFEFDLNDYPVDEQE